MMPNLRIELRFLIRLLEILPIELAVTHNLRMKLKQLEKKLLSKIKEGLLLILP